MNTSERIRTGESAAMPQEFASAVNLFAHPLAGMAAASALGFGLASHAWGLWLGSFAGVAEASQKLVSETSPEAGAKPVAVAPLKLVVSRPAVEKKQAEARDAGAKPLQTLAHSALDGRPVAMAKPEQPDDLKAIAGVGPKLEKVLNGYGLWTYGQIAGLSSAEIAWLNQQLGFGGRIERDGWVNQANALQVR